MYPAMPVTQPTFLLLFLFFQTSPFAPPPSTVVRDFLTRGTCLHEAAPLRFLTYGRLLYFSSSFPPNGLAVPLSSPMRCAFRYRSSKHVLAEKIPFLEFPQVFFCFGPLLRALLSVVTRFSIFRVVTALERVHTFVVFSIAAFSSCEASSPLFL